MKRFRRILLAVVLLAVFAVLVWALQPAPAQIKVSGKFSPGDIAEISALVKRDLQRNILPDLSWNSFKGMPRAVKLRLRYEITSINEASPNGAVVDVKASHKSPKSSFIYVFTRGTNGWDIDKHAGIMASGGSISIIRLEDSTITLPETNSTGAK